MPNCIQISMVLCLMTVLALSACSHKTVYSDSVVTEVNTYPNVSMGIIDEDIRLDLMTLLIVNNNDYAIEGGRDDFWVEEYRDGKWQVIEVEERDGTGEAVDFYGQQLYQIDVSSVYGELPEGHYRILKSFKTKNPDEIITFCLSSEFDIKK